MRLSLKYPPREWQIDALEQWRKRSRGVVEVVTGGGKTVFSQMCLQQFFGNTDLGKKQALIVVPSVSLLDQWWVALQDESGVLPKDIGLLSGRDSCRGDEPIIISVVNSARHFTSELSKSCELFLVVDECHRVGSPSNSKALLGEFSATLGLSATPEREYDEGFKNYIEPRLGPVIYRYTYISAAQDGIICPFSLINVRVDLLPDEEEQYRKYSTSIARAIGRSADGQFDEFVKRMLQLRASVAANATRRIPVSIKLIERHRGQRAIIFHERIDAANHILSILQSRGHRATAYHAKIGPDARRDNLRLFRNGQFDVMVCCRALDEGMNVPEVSVAVVASCTASQRQRIQRLGRILRPSNDKNMATIYTIFATTEERIRLEAEEAKLLDVTSVNWLQGEMESNASDFS